MTTVKCWSCKSESKVTPGVAICPKCGKYIGVVHEQKDGSVGVMEHPKKSVPRFGEFG